MMPAAKPNLIDEFEERLRFEMLIADLSSKFVNLPAGQVDREIMEAEGHICELLGLDFSALWQWSDEAPGFFTLTHFYSAQAGPQPPERMHQDQYPWAREQLLAGRTIRISSPEELPPEAARDRETLRQFGITSNLAIPLSVGGEPALGILGLGTMGTKRDWPDAVVKRLQLVAQIFTNALARKRTEATLRASEARLAAGTELAGLGYYEVNYGERHCYLDDRFRQICGVPAEVQQGLDPVQFWLEHVHPEDRQFLADERQKLHEGKVDRIHAEYRYLHPAQGQRWLHHSARLAGRSPTGEGIRTFGVIRDITSRKQAEWEAKELRGNLAHADRVTLLGQLASALAHELSQPLGAILRNAEAAEIMLQESSPDLEELRAIITDILRDDQRAGQVIDRLRSLLKRRSLDLQPIELPGLAAEVLSLVHADAAARQVKVTCSVAPGLPPVRGDRIHLQQVLLNLLLNAMDALEGRAQPRSIQVSARGMDSATVEVRVSDNGPGIPHDALERLFEPFFTTKAKGMGMGLAVCKTIIEAHKGRLWAENRPEGGACFCFTLPAAGGSMST